jgi:hypothetical protein
MIPKVWQWMNEFRPFMVDDCCPKSLNEMYEKHHADLIKGALEYAFVDENEKPLGVVWAEKFSDGIYFGHLVFEREVLTPSDKFRCTQSALNLMYASGAKKVIWLSLDSNRPFKLFLRKLKAEKRELVPEGALCDGVPVPVQIYVSESVNQ